MKRKPIIGISGSIIRENSGDFPGYERAYVNNDYIQSVIRAGGIPYIIPVTEDEEIIREYSRNIDGLILSGGHDVNPLLWSEEPLKELGEVFVERDKFDFLLIETVFELKKPILAICRGEQILNVFFGGTLYQDLSYKKDSFVKHNQRYTPTFESHSIEIEKNSKLFEIFKEKNLFVNSFHHMAIKDVAPGFKKVAVSKDGVIEGIEMCGEEFIIGVQWHPEMLSKKNIKMQKLFNRFVEVSIEMEDKNE
ncbi:gamma-glutamyl-gamma-aminobutyrate hydrolase family protein [Cetobacterium sp. 8H]|uniref:gamma-glutamyl-gamma-aminobutyrate hydrolase family protein n=1 Tax=Cetobacterium sp. 8H TaxID=2759681 RepID=UPI00163BEB39|nr:gamma-glutamyl-gamma-aminobutyrate hydrolase family protein [Cetobacterium sp. 8H]MBC2850206.1 gamma-glutamyl-gamma-aminobutyrate hydrolase family protein [Cetobacterium sp. 8H]